jgi:hypothetical protein
MGWSKRAGDAAKEECLGQEMVAETLGVLENVRRLVALEWIRQEMEILDSKELISIQRARKRGECAGANRMVEEEALLQCRSLGRGKGNGCTWTQKGIPVRTSISLPSLGLPPAQPRTDAKSLSPLEPLSSRLVFLEEAECGVLGDTSPAPCSEVRKEDAPGFKIPWIELHGNPPELKIVRWGRP